MRQPADVDQAVAVPPEESATELYEHAPCGYVSTTPDGTIVRVNETLLAWTAHRREELVGRRRFQDLLTPGGRIYHETHYAPLLRMQGTVREIALELVCRDGRRLPVLINSVLRRDSSGAPAGVRTSIFDATDRKSYERELLRARERERAARENVERLLELGRHLDEVPTMAERAQRLVDGLVPTLARAARVVAGDPEHPTVLAAAGEPLDSGGHWLELPLRARGRRLGALAACAEHPLDEQLFAQIADRAGVALENARLYDEQRSVAQTLQQSLLGGQPPRHPRYEIAALYEPSAATLDVGGDWYDTIAASEDRVLLAVGDVVGRGIEAAAAMGQLRSAIRALVIAGLGPAGILTRLDGFVHSGDVGMMATLACAELDLRSGRLRYACAGHPPPLLLAPDAEPRLLWDGRSMPLGVPLSGRPEIEGRERLAPGTRILLYTDGLVERRDRGLDEQLERLLDAAARLRRDSPAQMLTGLATAMTADESTADDTCALVCEYAGEPEAAGAPA